MPRCRWLFVCLVIALAGGNSIASAASGTVGLINLTPDDAIAISSAVSTGGLTLMAMRPGVAVPPNMRLIVLQSKNSLSDEQARALGRAVQNGTSLLVTFGEGAGPDAYIASFMLPTMAWDFRLEQQGPLGVSEFDSGVFGSEAPSKLTVPFVHEIRPFHAVERGQARYDEIEHQLLFSNSGANGFLPPGSNEWSRPLIDRDWKIAARLEGALGLPLLITGRYGRGRVAVFASGASALDHSPSGEAFWKSVIDWLLKSGGDQQPSAGADLPQPTIAVDAASRVLHVTVSNPTSQQVTATVIGRIMTWEPAIIGDVQQPISIPASASQTVDLAMPAADDHSYAAVAARDVYEVRLGVLAGDGSKLIAPETRVHADLRPAMLMALHTDDIRNYAWPYDPAPKFAEENRMGTRVDEYAYKPGETVHAQMELDNGARNIASLAKAADETTPNNPSTSALNDGWAMSERGYDSSAKAYGYWFGKQGIDNTVTLTFPRPMLVNALVLVGAGDAYRHQDRKNPSGVIVDVDGKTVAKDLSLPDKFLSCNGRVRLEFAATRATKITLRFPWQSGAGRDMPALGDVEVWGTTADSFAPPASGDVTVSWRDNLSGTQTAIGQQHVEIASGGYKTIDFDVPMPQSSSATFYVIEATGLGQTADLPIMTIAPKTTIISMDALKGKPVEEGFIVTKGFRNVFKLGTGTAEPSKGWASPDDLAWAYSRGLKENGLNSSYQAGKLYTTENDLRHYSTNWRHFLDGELFYDVATPLLVKNYSELPAWKSADTAVLAHTDRWDSGPPVGAQYAWQEFIAFDEWLRAKGLGKLTGKTKKELIAEINEKYSGPWYAYQLENYQRSLRELREAFAAAGKKLLLTAQGCPLVTPKYGEVICDVVRGTSDDSTWGMVGNDIIATTGKQMGAVAFNPYLAMSTLLQWNYNSSTLNNQQWHVPAGTAEPSRRHIYNRAFRGVIRLDGAYTSMHTYGFNLNAGSSMRLDAIDYMFEKRVRDLHTLLLPDAPVGAGLVIGNSYLDDLRNTRFGSDPMASEESRAVSAAISVLERSGVSIPFSANVLSLEKWKGTDPLIVLNLQKLTLPEIKIIADTIARGVRVAAFVGPDETLAPDAAALFGVNPQGSASDGVTVGMADGRPIVAKGTALFVPLDPTKMGQSEVDPLGQLLIDRLAIPIQFDAGSCGYGFMSNGREFVVAEDWREEARTMHLRVRLPDAKGLSAINVNDGAKLSVARDGADWVIDVPTRPADGNLICLQAN